MALAERLAAEAGQGGEAHGRLHPREVHVVQAGFGVVAPGTHVVVGDRSEGHLLLGIPGRGDHPLVGVDEVFVDPAIDLDRGVLVEVLDIVGCADIVDLADATPLHLWPAVLEPGGEPMLPDVGRLDHVVVDADQLRDAHSVAPCERRWLRRRVRSVSTATMSRPDCRASCLIVFQSSRLSCAAWALSFHFCESGVVISKRIPLGSWK